MIRPLSLRTRLQPLTAARRALVACVLLAGTAACKDAGGDPLAVIITQGTRSALEVEARLPSPPRLAKDAHAEKSLEAALERWTASWEVAPEAGRSERTDAYEELALPLSEAMGRDGLAESLQTVDDAVAAATALGPQTLVCVIGANVQEAKAEHAAGVAALDGGHEAEALTHALHAADLLREVGPEGVTRMLVARAERELALRAESRESKELPEDEARSQRLLRGARIALDAGDYALAIERAFYSCQLLKLDPMAP